MSGQKILPGTGRGTARSGVEGLPALPRFEQPLHHPADGPPPRSGEDWRKPLAFIAAAAVLTFGVAQAQQSARTGPTAPELAQGRAVYAHWCAPCHAASPRLAGTMSLAAKYEGRLPPALEDRTDLTAPVIALFVRNGVAWMPPFRPTEVSDADLAALSAYLTAPLDQRGAHAPLLAREMAELEAAR